RWRCRSAWPSTFAASPRRASRSSCAGSGDGCGTAGTTPPSTCCRRTSPSTTRSRTRTARSRKRTASRTSRRRRRSCGPWGATPTRRPRSSGGGSWRRSASVLDARVERNPVRLPRFAAVVGERLLEAAGAGGDAGDHELHEKRAAVERFLIVELAAAVAELADRRLRHLAVRGVGEVQRPLLRLRMIETHADGLEVAPGAVGDELDDVGAAVEERAYGGDPLHLDPLVPAGERLG